MLQKNNSHEKGLFAGAVRQPSNLFPLTKMPNEEAQAL